MKLTEELVPETGWGVSKGTINYW